jgi:hypothetical protein
VREREREGERERGEGQKSTVREIKKSGEVKP